VASQNLDCLSLSLVGWFPWTSHMFAFSFKPVTLPSLFRCWLRILMEFTSRPSAVSINYLPTDVHAWCVSLLSHYFNFAFSFPRYELHLYVNTPQLATSVLDHCCGQYYWYTNPFRFHPNTVGISRVIKSSHLYSEILGLKSLIRHIHFQSLLLLRALLLFFTHSILNLSPFQLFTSSITGDLVLFSIRK
jgi:hypothetical protein